jgi:hypothetical protein
MPDLHPQLIGQIGLALFLFEEPAKAKEKDPELTRGRSS